MNIRRLFQPFRKRLLGEAMLRSLLIALGACGASLFLLSLVFHILVREMPLLLALTVGGGAFLVAFAVAFFRFYYPTDRRVAARIDALGLQERVSTMLAHRGDTSELARLQRQDAVEKLGGVDARQIRFSFSRKSVLIAAVSIVLAASMLILPYNAFSFRANASGTHMAGQAQFIRDLVARLRSEVEASELPDRTKTALFEIIDRLEEDLRQTDSELAQAARIEQARAEITALLAKALTKNAIGESLKNYPLTFELGDALVKGKKDGITTALDVLEASLNQRHPLIKELSEDVRSALDESGVSTNDDLYKALFIFHRSLSLINLEGDSVAKGLKSACDTLETAILAALEKQAVVEAALTQLTGTLTAAKNAALNSEPMPTDGAEEDTDEQNQFAGGSDKAEPMGGNFDEDAPIEEDESMEGEMPDDAVGGSMLETDEEGIAPQSEDFFDPMNGRVTYGEVYAAYYVEYLMALQAGNVPEELQSVIDNYFLLLH